MTPADLLIEARGLLSEDGENSEYDRAIVELTTRLLGLSHDHDADVRAALAPPLEVCCNEHPYCDLCGEFRVRYRLTDVGTCHQCLLTALDTLKETP